MHYVIVGEDQEERFDQFVFNSPYGHVLQTFAWARVKKAWKPFGIAVLDGEEIVASVLILKRKLPLVGSMFYAPRGPIWNGEREDVLTCLLTGIRYLAKRERAYVLRMDPDVPYGNETYRKMMEEHGLVLLPDAENLEHIQSQHLMRVDLVGKTPQQVLDSFKRKKRYYVRLAQRNGVYVEQGTKEDLEIFFDLMQQTGERDHFAIRSRSYFEDIMDSFGERAALFFAKDETGMPLAGALCLQGAGKLHYLYGASSNEKRKLAPTYLLQWDLIQYAMHCGCKLYDLRGVPKNPESSDIEGLYRFKSGFGGCVVDLVGEYHDIYRPVLYKILECLLPYVRTILCRLKIK